MLASRVLRTVAQSTIVPATQPGSYLPSEGSALAVYSRASTDRADARLRALALYKAWMKNADTIVGMYYLDMPASQLRERIRVEFEKHRYVTDPGVIDVMLWKGQLELQETMNLWKQKTHLMRYFEGPNEIEAHRQQGDFMDRFLAGKE
ncbi:ndufa6 NADH-ubiquinone oxidoreductase subunit [Sorochytrium milnesiophthora]